MSAASIAMAARDENTRIDSQGRVLHVDRLRVMRPIIHTDIPEAPWFEVDNEDKRRGRINMIHHLLGSIPWEPVARQVLTLPDRKPSTGYERPPREVQRDVPDHASTLI